MFGSSWVDIQVCINIFPNDTSNDANNALKCLNQDWSGFCYCHEDDAVRLCSDHGACFHLDTTLDTNISSLGIVLSMSFLRQQANSVSRYDFAQHNLNRTEISQSCICKHYLNLGRSSETRTSPMGFKKGFA